MKSYKIVSGKAKKKKKGDAILLPKKKKKSPYKLNRGQKNTENIAYSAGKIKRIGTASNSQYTSSMDKGNNFQSQSGNRSKVQAKKPKRVQKNYISFKDWEAGLSYGQQRWNEAQRQMFYASYKATQQGN